MNIQVSDQQQLLNEIELKNAQNRVLFALARFSWRLGRVTVHLTRDNRQNGGLYQCLIHVQVKGRGSVMIRRSATSRSMALTRACDRIETRVAHRVDWRSRFRLDRAAETLAVMGQALRWLAETGNRRGFSR